MTIFIKKKRLIPGIIRKNSEVLEPQIMCIQLPNFSQGPSMSIWVSIAFQIALQNWSKKVGGKVSIYVILVKEEYMQSSTYFLQMVTASLVKVTALHEEQMSPWRILGFSTYKDMQQLGS